jgi:hypothetical protein
MSLIKKVGLCSVALLFVAMAAIPANNAEQIVFSKTGGFMTLVGNSKPATPFGFWIWCAGSAAPPSSGGYQIDNACQGSMYFYALATPTMGVVGHVTEGPAGIYTMHVEQGTAAQFFSGTLNPAFNCTLNNTTANPPGNPVNVSCMFTPSLGGGMGTATVADAVVNVTGPQ